MANIRINSLPSEASPSASDVVPIDGATTRKTTLTALVNAGRPLASQAEAEAGTDAAKAMTPLTTAQAIAAQGAGQFASAAQGATADSALQPGAIGVTVQAYNALLDSVSALPLVAGDILYAPGPNTLQRLPAGVDGQVIRQSAGLPSWATATGLGDLLAVNNLGDVDDADQALENLGGVKELTTVAAAALFAPLVTQNWLRTAGYAAIGDGGGALYKKVVSEPSHAGKFQTADGTWWELAEPVIDIRMFGASTAESGAANAIAVNNAFAAAQFVTAPAGTFDIGAALTTGAFRTLRGTGRFETIFNKTFNGDMIALGTGSNIYDVSIIGNGATRTGRGVTIGTGTGAQIISKCRIDDFAGYCVEYTAQQAGSQSTIENCYLGRTTPGDVCVKYPNDAGNAAPRWLVNTLTNGPHTLCDTDGAQNLFIIGGYCNNITFGANAGKVLVWGTRIALVGATLTVNGSDLIMDGCAIAGSVTWLAGSGSTFGDNNIISGTFTDGTNSGQVCKLYHIGTTFTPTWGADTANPVLGNGTLTGQIAARGKFRHYTIQLAMGTTTTFGTGPWFFSLKGSNELAKTTCTGSVYALDAGTSFKIGTCYIEANTNKIRIVSHGDANLWGPTIPQTWANLDNLRLSIDIELA